MVRFYSFFLLAFLISMPVLSAAATNPVAVEVLQAIIGKGPRYVGYNQGHFMPGSNTAAWIRRTGINCFRIWLQPDNYEPTDDIAPYGDGVVDQSSFNVRRNALRADPENPLFINFDAFHDRFQNYQQTGVNRCVANDMLHGARELGLTTVVELDERAYSLPGTWADRWEHWQRHYAMGYYLAKNFDVSLFETCNEPDQDSRPASEAEYHEWTRFADDALRCAVLDVNAAYGKSLIPTIIAPTLKIFSNIDTYGKTKLNSIRTNYQDEPIPYDNFQVYCTHQYNATAPTFVSQIATLQEKIPAYHAAGQMLPVMYTEFNRYNTSTWAGASAGVSLENPVQFTEVAEILASSMVQGVYGMTAFKFSETYSASFGKYRTGFCYVWDMDQRNISGAKKGVDAIRLFARAFAGERNRIGVNQIGASAGFSINASVDETSGVYRLFCNNTSSVDDVALTISFVSLDVDEGSTVTVEEVSSVQQAGIVAMPEVPANRELALTQPALSTWLITVPKGTSSPAVLLPPIADSVIRGGAYQAVNYGADASMIVKTTTTNKDVMRKCYLKFDLQPLPENAVLQRAILQVHGRNPIDSTIYNLHVYGSDNDSWTEEDIRWNNAPDHSPTTTTVVNQGSSAWPLGNMSFNSVAQPQRLDVTPIVVQQNSADRQVTFILSRETRFATDTDDNFRHVTLATRENTDSAARPQLMVYYTTDPIAVALSAVQAE